MSKLIFQKKVVFGFTFETVTVYNGLINVLLTTSSTAWCLSDGLDCACICVNEFSNSDVSYMRSYLALKQCCFLAYCLLWQCTAGKKQALHYQPLTRLSCFSFSFYLYFYFGKRVVDKS